MSRIADVLERESTTVDLEQGDFERLLGRRERKERNRRISAGVLGVIVALAVGFVLVKALTSDNRVPRTPPEPKPLGSGEVLEGGKNLAAWDPNSGEERTIVEARALPRREGSITRAAWSSDRKWVAFRRGNGSSGGSLWVADSTGGALRRLAPVGGYSRWAWSPTQDQVVLVRRRDVTL